MIFNNYCFLLSIYEIQSLQTSRTYAIRRSCVSHASFEAIPFHKVEMKSDFWRPRLITQRKVLVPFAFEKTVPGVEHLQAAADYLAGKKVENHRPHRFIDSDLYKVMEGAAYLAQLQDDPELEAQFDRIVEVIAAAQEPNGYLYPSHTTKVGTSKSMMGDEPYTFVVHSHELYNMGHLYEAAIAYFLATGKDKLLEVAEKNAQHVNQVFLSETLNTTTANPSAKHRGIRKWSWLWSRCIR